MPFQRRLKPGRVEAGAIDFVRDSASIMPGGEQQDPSSVKCREPNCRRRDEVSIN